MSGKAFLAGTVLLASVASPAGETKGFYRPYETGDSDQARVKPHLPMLESARPAKAVRADLAKRLSSKEARQEAEAFLGAERMEKLAGKDPFEMAKVAPPRVKRLDSLGGQAVILDPQFVIEGNDPSFREGVAFFVPDGPRPPELLSLTGLELAFCGTWGTRYDAVETTSVDGEPALGLRELRTYCVEGDEPSHPDRLQWLVFLGRDRAKKLGTFPGKALPQRLCRATQGKQLAACAP